MKKIKKLSSVFVYILAFMLLISSAFAVQLPVNLGTAADFVVLSKSGISTTGTTAIVGNIGVSPITSSAITGFGLIMDSTNQFSTSSLVTGKVFAADYTVPTPTKMTTAVSDMETAYTNAAGRALPDQIDLGAGEIGGLTLVPGLYKWGTGVTISTDVTLSGNSNAVWIFQIAQDLEISSGKKILLSGGAQAKNIFWQVAGQAVLGTNSVFNGNILSQNLIAMKTGSILNGRALAQKAVTLDSNKIFLSSGYQVLPGYATLNVTKVVINDNGGNRSVNSFILKVNGKIVNSSIESVFIPGFYTVTETKDTAYKTTFSGNCNSAGSIYLSAGDVKRCVITNNDIAPYNSKAKITVIKKVINDNGGNRTAGSFVLKLNGNTVVNGQQSTVNPGSYVVSEILDPKYKATYSGNCNAYGNLYLSAGDVKNCTITNNDIAPYNSKAKITVIKKVINDNGGNRTADSFVLKLNGNTVVNGQQSSVNPGSYVVSEILDPKYKATYSGNCNAYGNLYLSAGDVKNCTITNNDILPPKVASMIVIKIN